ncbi:hypothetical protein [Wenzhouxiangella marina]|uniref:Uncharacterized protein n=1 Tax=Wenzhouxiangella marina TaxID=1579979 RepID=A0A0K0XW33_9GAMM|nr:hypothetical protein [Wenzhouxiangella marina]AKS41826.1 hypothetical protein WM2015_1454 [Wenzhouxiangella marina]MBB6086412.1 hypothetical protein [Wenzhouxiangella marina]
MFYRYRSPVWGAFLCLLFLSGCVTTKPISEVGFPLEESGVFITATQKELETEASNTNAMAAGGGLLGVLIVHAIDSSKNRRAEEAIGSIRDALIDVPLAEEFSQRILDSGLTDQISVLEPEILYEVLDEDYEYTRDFIGISPTVRITNDLSDLKVSLALSEFSIDNRNRPRYTGFSQSYTFVHPLPEPDEDDDRDAYAEAWLAMGVDEKRELIFRGMDATIQAAIAHIEEGDWSMDADRRYRIPDYTGRIRYFHVGGTDETHWLVMNKNVREVLIVQHDSAVAAE